MKYPEFIKSDKTVYLASPSFGCATSYYKPRLDKAIANVSGLGINLIKGPYIYNDGILSSTPENLGKEIMDAWSKYDLIWSVAGGEVMVKILDYIDFDKIASSTPKWFMGYSDNTNLTFLLTTICDVASIYGACTPEFGSENLSQYNYDLIDLIKGNKLEFTGYDKYEVDSLKSDENPYANLNATVKSYIHKYNMTSDKISGRLVGGCIDVISCLVGTKYDNTDAFNKKYDDIIFFFEACDMNPIEVARRLIQFKNAGWFKKTKAIVFGRPLNDSDMFGVSYEKYIIDALDDLNIPLLFGLDIGHVKPQIPVICGSTCDIELIDETYKITYTLK